MAKNNFWESLKEELAPELSESASHFDQEYSKLIEKLSEEAYSQLKAFVKSCKPVPKDSSSLLVTIQGFRFNRYDEFCARVTGEYLNTPIVKTRDLVLFSITSGDLIYKGTNLERDIWYAADDIFDSAILSHIHNKLFVLREIFGDSYSYEFPIVWNEQ